MQRTERSTKAAGRWLGVIGVAGWLMGASGGTVPARAQEAKTGAAVTQTDSRIVAESAPYRIEWDGMSGTLTRSALGTEAEQKMPLVYLHADAGPKGYSKHLAWFLARDQDNFAILWCYLNDTGKEFWCWLYRFPGNQLTTQLFTGDYHFTPLPEPIAPAPLPLSFDLIPRYIGPNFTFGNWTRRTGTIARLELNAGKYQGNEATANATGSKSAPPPVKTLTNLQVTPLHEIHVAAGNGWREGGWRELHALAQDTAQNPYYLILYSHSTRGFVVDLKQAVTYTADFGAKVNFPDADKTFSGVKNDGVDVLPAPHVRRYDRHELTFTTQQTVDNAYTDVTLLCEFKTPEGKSVVIPGFWTGEKTWRVRFAPLSVGTWTWKTQSNLPDLDGQQGTLECVADDGTNKGFVRVQTTQTYHHHFATMDEKPFYPAMIRDPVTHFATPPAPAGKGATKTVALETEPPKADAPPSFVAFQKRVAACAALGFNRFIGGYLLDKPDFAAKTQANEGGAPFLNYDLDRLNPAYFEWMDKRVAYCIEKGIVPDIGIGYPDKSLLSEDNRDKLTRLWTYLVARYGSYDICWNLFGADGETAVSQADVEEFAKLTRQYDPYTHPLTTATPGPTMYVPPVAPMPEKGSKTGARGIPMPKQDGKPEKAKPMPVVAPPAIDWGTPDVITQLSGDLMALSGNWNANRPLVLLEHLTLSPAEAMTPEVARQRLWETRMRGGYWTGGLSAASGPDALNSPEVKWAALCARFFRETHFWRLDPHADMLDKPEPTSRRKRSSMPPGESATGEQPKPIAPPSPAPGSAPPSPAFVLADPGWEYVLYLPKGGKILLDLLEATGRLKAFWFNPRTGRAILIKEANGKDVFGGAYKTFTAPDANDWVLYLSRR